MLEERQQHDLGREHDGEEDQQEEGLAPRERVAAPREGEGRHRAEHRHQDDGRHGHDRAVPEVGRVAELGPGPVVLVPVGRDRQPVVAAMDLRSVVRSDIVAVQTYGPAEKAV